MKSKLGLGTRVYRDEKLICEVVDTSKEYDLQEGDQVFVPSKLFFADEQMLQKKAEKKVKRPLVKRGKTIIMQEPVPQKDDEPTNQVTEMVFVTEKRDLGSYRDILDQLGVEIDEVVKMKEVTMVQSDTKKLTYDEYEYIYLGHVEKDRLSSVIDSKKIVLINEKLEKNKQGKTVKENKTTLFTMPEPVRYTFLQLYNTYVPHKMREFVIMYFSTILESFFIGGPPKENLVHLKMAGNMQEVPFEEYIDMKYKESFDDMLNDLILNVPKFYDPIVKAVNSLTDIHLDVSDESVTKLIDTLDWAISIANPRVFFTPAGTEQYQQFESEKQARKKELIDIKKQLRIAYQSLKSSEKYADERIYLANIERMGDKIDLLISFIENYMPNFYDSDRDLFFKFINELVSLVNYTKASSFETCPIDKDAASSIVFTFVREENITAHDLKKRLLEETKDSPNQYNKPEYFRYRGLSDNMTIPELYDILSNDELLLDFPIGDFLFYLRSKLIKQMSEVKSKAKRDNISKSDDLSQLIAKAITSYLSRKMYARNLKQWKERAMNHYLSIQRRQFAFNAIYNEVTQGLFRQIFHARVVYANDRSKVMDYVNIYNIYSQAVVEQVIKPELDSMESEFFSIMTRDYEQYTRERREHVQEIEQETKKYYDELKEFDVKRTEIIDYVKKLEELVYNDYKTNKEYLYSMSFPFIFLLDPLSKHAQMYQAKLKGFLYKPEQLYNVQTSYIEKIAFFFPELAISVDTKLTSKSLQEVESIALRLVDKLLYQYYTTINVNYINLDIKTREQQTMKIVQNISLEHPDKNVKVLDFSNSTIDQEVTNIKEMCKLDNDTNLADIVLCYDEKTKEFKCLNVIEVFDMIYSGKEDFSNQFILQMLESYPDLYEKYESKYGFGKQELFEL